MSDSFDQTADVLLVVSPPIDRPGVDRLTDLPLAYRSHGGLVLLVAKTLVIPRKLDELDHAAN